MGEELGRQCEVGAPGVCSSVTLSHRGGQLTGLGGPWKGEAGRWGADATFFLILPLFFLSPWGDTQLDILAYSQGKTRGTTARRGSPRSQHPGHPGHPGLRKPRPGRGHRASVTGGGRETCCLLGSRDSFCEQTDFPDAGVTVMVMMVVVG